MSKKKQISLLVLGLFITISMVVGVTYAIWSITLQQTNSNVITTGCFNVTLEEGDAITLNNAYPMTNEEGMSLTPYTFTIKNNCSEKASYVLNLETVSSGEKILSDEYVKASLKNSGSELFLSNLNSTKENLEKVIAESVKAYKLTEGVLQANEEKTFELRLWMDESTPTMDEVMNASYMGKITVISSYVAPPNIKNMMVPMEMGYSCNSGGCDYGYNATYTQGGTYQDPKYDINKVIFQSEINPYENAVEVVDFSVAQDKSILGYYIKDENSTEEEKYQLYIQADGKVKLNPNGSLYGSVYSGDFHHETIEVQGIENWDTSLVTDMSYMFYGSPSNSLDVSHFDTSKVTSMYYMFANMNNITSLDLSHFNTPKVTDMSLMFANMNSLVNLDVSHFDTSNVTDMSYMFSGLSGLTSNLTTITYGDRFIHKENADITGMFYNCPANKPTHSSWNDVTW